jgi:hypothetical protein
MTKGGAMNTETAGTMTHLPEVVLEGGYPRASSIGALFDELDFQRAVQVYLWALPAVSCRAFFDAMAEVLGADNTTVPVFEHFLDAKTIIATGNGQSIYSAGVIDLAEGPVVVEAPPGVLGFIMSLWQFPLEDIGPLGPDKGKGGSFLLVPPDHQEGLPDGYFVVPCDTYTINVGIRGFVEGGRTEPAVEQIRRMRVYRLAEREQPPEMTFVDASGTVGDFFLNGDNLDTIAYFRLLAKVINYEPVREKDKVMLGLAASLGLVKGKPFEPDARMAAILADAARVGRAMAAAQSYSSRYPARHTWEGTQCEEIWQTEVASMENDNFVEVDAKTTFAYQAMGSAKAAMLSVVGAGSKYSGAFRDAHGQWLQGANRYRLRVPRDVPAKQFWSVTVYDAETRSMIDNKQGVSGRDSYQTTLAANDDGSTDLYFAPEPPAGHEGNWVQTNPGTGFFVYFRWYGPLEPYFDKTWQLPDVELLDEEIA